MRKMTIAQSAKSLVISSAIDEIIIEKFIAKTIKFGDALSLDYLTNMTGYSEKEIKFLKNYENDLFSVEQNSIRVTANIDTLSLKAKEYILHLIKKYVYTSEHDKHTFAYDVGKFIDDKYYNQHELDFIYEILNTFLDISNIELNSFNLPPDKSLLLYNAINYNNFHYAARDVYNGIIQGSLHIGDNIAEVIKKSWESEDKNKLLPIFAYSKLYEWFFEITTNKQITLRCDIDNNKNLFIVNFINTIIYRFRDDKARVKLLRQMHVKFGLLREKY